MTQNLFLNQQIKRILFSPQQKINKRLKVGLLWALGAAKIEKVNKKKYKDLGIKVAYLKKRVQ